MDGSSDETGATVFKIFRGTLLDSCVTRQSSQTRPFPVIYYPGTPHKSQARVFTIEEGETIGLDVKVPPLPAESEIRGQVVWPDGKPATKARVIYLLPLEGIANSVEVDAEGRFSFKAYHGLAFVISATVEVTKGKYANSNRVRSSLA